MTLRGRASAGRIVVVAGLGEVMAHWEVKHTAPWRNRFVQPTVDALIGEGSRPGWIALVSAREEILAIRGVRESVAWLGIPWRWTLVYGPSRDEVRAWFYLVPNPERPILAAVLRTQHACGSSLEGMPTVVREGFECWKVVGDTAWGQWALSSKAQACEVVRCMAALRKGRPVRA